MAQFSDTTTRTGLIQLCEDFSKLGILGISGNAILLQRFTNLINIAYGEVVSAIMKVDKNWKWDDSNYTDYPEASITLVDSQRDYELPVASTGANTATLLRINRVWVLLTDGVTRQELTLMGQDEDFDTSSTGMPSKYRLNGKSIYIDQRPATGSVTLTGGLVIQFQRIPDAFLSTDTTQQPGFMQTYHHLLALKASAWYLLPVEPSLSLQYSSGREDAPGMFETGIKNLQADYAGKTDDAPRGIRTKPICHI